MKTHLTNIFSLSANAFYRREKKLSIEVWLALQIIAVTANSVKEALNYTDLFFG